MTVLKEGDRGVDIRKRRSSPVSNRGQPFSEKNGAICASVPVSALIPSTFTHTRPITYIIDHFRIKKQQFHAESAPGPSVLQGPWICAQLARAVLHP